MNKVSVIVPVFNAGNKLKKCIKSILKQSFKEFELILVNDGSTDSSLDICNEFKNKEKDIKITVIDKKNEGSILTRRKGLEIAQSEYIMFVDADDWIHRNMLETLYRETNGGNIDITVCESYKVLDGMGIIKKRNGGKYFNESKVFNNKEIKRDLIVAYFHGHPFPSSLCAKLYRKEFLLDSGKYLERIEFLGDDLYYNLEVMLKINSLKIINKPLYYIRVGGFTNNYMPTMFNDMINGYQIQKEVINEHFLETIQKHYRGISIMLLNTFKTGLSNLFKSNLNEIERKKVILQYTGNQLIRESIQNKGSINYFTDDFLTAIEERDINFLYKLGQGIHNKGKYRRILLRFLSLVG